MGQKRGKYRVLPFVDIGRLQTVSFEFALTGQRLAAADESEQRQEKVIILIIFIFEDVSNPPQIAYHIVPVPIGHVLYRRDVYFIFIIPPCLNFRLDGLVFKPQPRVVIMLRLCPGYR